MPGAPIGTIVYLIGRFSERNNKCYENWNNRHSKVSLKQLFNFLKDQIARKSKDAFLKIQKIFETCKKRF